MTSPGRIGDEPSPGRRPGLLGLCLLALSWITWKVDTRVGGIPVTTAQWVALGLVGLGAGCLALSVSDTWRGWRLGARPWFLLLRDEPWIQALLVPATRRDYLVIASFAAAAVAVGLAAHALTFGAVFPIDDAYITLRNAEMTGRQPDRVFGSAFPWLGSTSLLHTSFVFLGGFVAPGAWATELVTWLGAMAYAMGIVRLAEATRSSAAVTFLSLLVGLLGGYSAFLLVNGMETGLVLATVTWSLVFTIDPRPSWALPVIAGALPFVRPELVALSVPLFVAWNRAQAEALTDRDRSWTRGLLIMGAVAIPLSLLSVLLTGSVVPGTVSAKAAWFAESCLSASIRTTRVAGALQGFLRDLGPASFGAVFLLSSRVGYAVLAFCCALIGSFWCFLPGGLFHNDSRYMAVLVPAVVLGGMLASQRGALASKLSLVVLAWGAFHAVERIPVVMGHLAGTVGFTRTELAPLGTWIETNTPVDAVLLVHDVGYIARGSDRKMIDLVGLKTPSSVEVHLRKTLAGCGRDRATAISEIAKASGATHLVVLVGWEKAFSIAAGLRRNGWDLALLRTGAYEVYRLTPPGEG